MVDTVSKSLAYYVRERHFDSDRMAGTNSHWKNTSSKDVKVPIQDLSLSGQSEKSSLNTPPTMSFGELLDVINPLHHLPIVGNIYRSMTGDSISPVAQIVGGTIFGGPLGGLASLANAAVQEHSGKDLSSAIVSSFKSDDVKYVFAEESRTAGEKTAEPEIIETAENEIATDIVTANNITWNTPDNEKRESVTRASIETAVAQVKKQQWNFNS